MIKLEKVEIVARVWAYLDAPAARLLGVLDPDFAPGLVSSCHRTGTRRVGPSSRARDRPRFESQPALTHATLALRGSPLNRKALSELGLKTHTSSSSDFGRMTAAL